MSKLIDLVGLSRFLAKCKELFLSKEDAAVINGTGLNSIVQNRTGAVASGESSVAEGSSIAKATRGHAEGNGCIVETTALNAHVEGYKNTVNGVASHAEGRNNITNNEAEHAEGKYNKSNANTIHSVGIGTSLKRKNAFEIMQNGDIYIIGLGGYDGTNVGAAGVKTLQQILSNV